MQRPEGINQPLLFAVHGRAGLPLLACQAPLVEARAEKRHSRPVNRSPNRLRAEGG